MTVRRVRWALIAVGVFGLHLGASVAWSLPGLGTQVGADGHWVCVGVGPGYDGFCQYNPLPDGPPVNPIPDGNPIGPLLPEDSPVPDLPPLP